MIIKKGAINILLTGQSNSLFQFYFPKIWKHLRVKPEHSACQLHATMHYVENICFCKTFLVSLEIRRRCLGWWDIVHIWRDGYSSHNLWHIKTCLDLDPHPPTFLHSSHIQGNGTNEDVRLVWQSTPASSTRTPHLFVMGIIRPTCLQNNSCCTSWQNYQCAQLTQVWLMQIQCLLVKQRLVSLQDAQLSTSLCRWLKRLVATSA